MNTKPMTHSQIETANALIERIRNLTIQVEHLLLKAPNQLFPDYRDIDSRIQLISQLKTELKQLAGDGRDSDIVFQTIRQLTAN